MSEQPSIEPLREWLKGGYPDRIPYAAIALTIASHDALTDEVQRLTKENGTLKACIKDDIETEEMAKGYALKVLPEIEVRGDSYGVPGGAGIVENLVNTVQMLKGELEVCQTAFRKEQQDGKNYADRLKGELERAQDEISKLKQQ